MSEQATATGVVPSGPFVVRAVLRTDVGRVRSENQDFGTLTTPAEDKGAHPGGRLMIVADGMGGHRGGATASRLAGETIKSYYLGGGTDDIAGALREALTRANSLIFAEAQTHAELHGMGTTTSALVVRGNEAWFAHVGDSRIYLIRGDEINQLTDDHSLVATMVREGLLTVKEAENHPRRNVLQRSIGVGAEVEIDVRGPLEVQQGDTFVLCSDGLHGLVKPEEIKEIVANRQIEAAADDLVDHALERGAPDNVTVIVARIEREDFDDEPTVVDREPDRVAFDDTVREERLSGAPVSSPAVRDAGEDTGAPPSTAPPRRIRGSTIIKWMLLFVVVLGAAGAWLFFAQQQMFHIR
ncbi:MAG TPA: Stp1/IreP family PP2C-type Ser/Thr phosphatase [Thermoanaerobaculia bacterium]|jgi:protein phosphatase|nr:Stp1/IreP family PP2C-type Ser/Thr phosphatase [Thermoanaerobaculia bacterium]